MALTAMATRPTTLGVIAALLLPVYAAALDGRITDAKNGQAIPDALVTVGQNVVRADARGVFHIEADGPTVAARAPGYLRNQQAVRPGASGMVELALTPFRPKALYLSFYGIGDKALRTAALDLLEASELNALVIDVKGDRGMIPYESAIRLAGEVGAQRIATVRDIRGLVDDMRRQGIYLIARIVVFKDDLLATARPELAVKTHAGAVWHDRERLAWADPFRQEAWNYNLDIAAEAAAIGFDEIQFDYLRFPDAEDVTYSRANTEQNRIGAISGFLAAARQRLAPYNVFIAADIFGYVLWNLNDTHIGQRLEALAPHLDYISPMLYPSGFQYGIPGFRDPVDHPREIVALSLKRAVERSGLAPVRFRPWLQAFRDYAFDHRQFTEAEIRQQIAAAEAFGSDGWMLWNPHNVYDNLGLHERVRPTPRP